MLSFPPPKMHSTQTPESTVVELRCRRAALNLPPASKSVLADWLSTSRHSLTQDATQTIQGVLRFGHAVVRREPWLVGTTRGPRCLAARPRIVSKRYRFTTGWVGASWGRCSATRCIGR